MTPIAIAHLDGAPTGVQFHPSGQFVLLRFEHRIEVRVAASGEKAWGASFPTSVDGAVFAEAGRSVVLASGDGLWRIREDEKTGLDVPARTLLGASPDGRWGLLHGVDFSLATIDLAILRVDAPFATTSFEPRQGAISNAGDRVLVGVRRETIEGYRTTAPGLVWVTEAADPFALHPDGSCLVHREIADTGGVQRIDWEKQMPQTWTPAPGALVFDVGYSADGSLLHVSGQHGVRLFAADGTSAGTLSHTGFGNAESGVTHGAFSPDGGLFAAVTLGRDLFVWDLVR